MNQQLSSLLDNIYNDAQGDAVSIEKTAEANLLEALQAGSQELSENPYETMSLEELTKLAQDHGLVEDDSGNDEQMEKAAFDALGGQVMAHSAFHELGLIKHALANGACRVCKENALDIQGSSICSTCLA